MSITIQNIKTSKEKYIFWDDKFIEVSFETLVTSNDYSNIIPNIIHETQILENDGVVSRSSKNINLETIQNLISWVPITTTFQISIDFPNLDDRLVVRNYIKIQYTNFLGISYCSSELYPSIVNRDNTPNIDPIFASLESFILSKRKITDSENYQKIQQKIDQLTVQTDNPMIRQQIVQLIDEQGRYFSISDEDKLLIDAKAAEYMQQEIWQSQVALNYLSRAPTSIYSYRLTTLLGIIVWCIGFIFIYEWSPISIYIIILALGILLVAWVQYILYLRNQRINIKFQSKWSIINIINQGVGELKLSDLIDSIQIPKKYANDGYHYNLSIYISARITETHKNGKYSSTITIGEISNIKFASYSGQYPELSNFQIYQWSWPAFLNKRIPIMNFSSEYVSFNVHMAESSYLIRIQNESDPTQEDIIYKIWK